MRTAPIVLTAFCATLLSAEEAGHDHKEQLRDGHADLLVLYEEIEGLHLAIAAGEHDHGGEETPGEGHNHDHEELDHVEIVAGPKAVQVTPAGTPWEFLGEPDHYLYVLPQSEIHGLPFLGLNSEELMASLFSVQPVLTLVSVDGPGDFFVYQVDSFGQPTVLMNSTLAEPGSYPIPEGTHVHMNWAFNEPGEYAVTFLLNATLTGGTEITSEPQVVTFHVVGQPTYIHEGEADIGVEYEADHGLEFYIAAEDDHHHEEHAGPQAEEEHEHGDEMHPADVTFLLGGHAVAEVPDVPAFAFLGAPGSEIYLIGQQEDEGVPYAGWSTEELDPLVFEGDVSFELHGVEGPGDVFLYDVDSIGNVTVIWNSVDPAEDVLTQALGLHRHLNLAVTAPGTYELEIHASVAQIGGNIIEGHAEITIQAGGLEGYFGHFHRDEPYWIEAETGGWLYTAGWPMLWSEDQGWLYAWGHGGPDHIYYDADDGDWMWTTPVIFPYYWSFEGDDWMMW